VFDVAAFALYEVDREALSVNPIGVSSQVCRQISECCIEDGQQRAKGILIARVGSCRNQHQVAILSLRQFAKEKVSLMLGAAHSTGVSAGVGFVHNDEFRAGTEKVISAMVGLDVVQRNDSEWVMLEEALPSSALGFKTPSCTGQDQLRLDLELALQLPLPLLSEVRRTEYRHASDFPAI
jgi:hypothetical protein